MSLPPSLEIPGPGVYPLETRECPDCDHGRRLAPHLLEVKKNPPTYVCRRCQGTGRVPNENGPKVRIGQHHLPGQPGNGKWWWSIPGPSWTQGFLGTAAEAFADAQRAHKEGKR